MLKGITNLTLMVGVPVAIFMVFTNLLGLASAVVAMVSVAIMIRE